MTIQEAHAICDEALAKLREHFDCVQILGSWDTDDGTGCTACVKRGSGNWWARQGMAHDFIKGDEAETLGSAVAEKMKEP